MCLETKHRRVKIAKEDIKCLKVVSTYKKASNDDKVVKHYCSFYTFNGTLEYVIGETVNDRKEISSLINYSPSSEEYEYRVESGIHTFTPEADGARSLYEWGLEEIATCGTQFHQEGVAILECVIPKGTKYFVGKATCFSESYGINESGYVSERLHVIRELDKEEIEKLSFVEVPY